MQGSHNARIPLQGLPSGLSLDADPSAIGRFFPQDGCSSTAASPGVVRPTSTAQIRDLLKWANDKRVPVVPVSSATGPRTNGGGVPIGAAVIADLSRMKRVRHIDGQDAIAVAEAGVTFPEFDAALSSHGLRSFKPFLPRHDKSVVTSHLERAPITSPREQWDSCDPIATVEMVFGSGEMFRTGSAAIPDELEDQIAMGLRQMSSIGPLVTDFLRVVMGSQGTLGVVSWASIYCERIPAKERAYYVGSPTLEPLLELSSRLSWRQLAAQTYIVNSLHLALALTDGPEKILDLAKRLPPWILFVNIGATSYFPDERISYETAALNEDAAALGLTAVRTLEGHAADRLTWLHQNLPDTHFKDRLSRSWDEIFFLTQIDAVVPKVAAYDASHARAGFALPYGVYIQPRVQGSSCHVEFSSFFAPSDGVSGSRRDQFHAATSRRLSELGAFFSRPYGIWNQIAFERDAQIVPYLRHAKAMFDPNAVLNPGKLCF